MDTLSVFANKPLPITFSLSPPQYIMTTQFLLLVLHCSDMKLQVDRKMKPHNTESIYWNSWWLPSSCPPSALSLLLKNISLGWFWHCQYCFHFANGFFSMNSIIKCKKVFYYSNKVFYYFINPTPGYHGAFKLFCNQENGNTLQVLRLPSHGATEKQG